MTCKSLFALAAAALLAACGDETTNNVMGLQTAESLKSLAKCNEENAGDMFFVADSSRVYYCNGDEWQTLNGKDGENGKDGADGKDGSNGTDGSDGQNGTDGKSTTTVDTIVKLDTLLKIDTIYHYDTLVTKDTIHSIDTLVMNHVDTVVVYDTTHSYDTTIVINKIPSVLYDCEKYDCVTTAYLNPFIEYGELLDERDNKVYRTVNIGTQTWMAQNLDYYDASEVALQGQAWCYYDDESYCVTFGRLYSWSAAMNLGSTYNTTLIVEGMVTEQHKGICPTGYHVPTKDEWVVLISYVDDNNGAETAGTSLKSRYLWQSRDSVSLGTDLFGFAALPGDDRVTGQKSTKMGTSAGYDDYVYRNAELWSATETSATNGLLVGTGFSSVIFSTNGNFSKAYGASLRCIKDEE